MRQHFILTAVSVFVPLACVLSFNVDQKNGLSFSGPLEDLFGYTVQQFENSEGKWVLIGSPLSGQPAKRTGDVYKCPVGNRDNTCIKLELPKNTTIPNLREVKENMTMGSTLVTNPKGGFLACGPQYGYMCGEQQFISGVCANVSSSFQVLNSFSRYQECGKEMDVVIVLDGSNSIYPWSGIQEFLHNFTGRLEIGPKLTQVGIVSYGQNVTHNVNLSQFDNTPALQKFVKVLPQHTGTKTMTFLGIDTARKEAFRPERGARSGVKKVMVIVTDGESHDYYNLKKVIDACDDDNIERFGIAVLGDYGRQNKPAAEVQKFIKEIQNISSDPVQDHFFNVADELALLSIVETLGSRILALEATGGNSTSPIEMEMSQTGFSAHTSHESVLLGAVGAYEWNGTVVMYTPGGDVVPGKDDFYDPKKEAQNERLAGYLGYDVQSASTSKGELYITGAPRYNHTGRVVVYRLDENNNIVISQILKGEQIGSYFGSVLQTVDVDNDSYTDLLLVGAPMYMGSEKDEQGRVYVYKLSKNDMFKHEFTLKPMNQSCCTPQSAGCTNKNEPCGARFGTAIAAVTDLNLDGYHDVAIGAPFENDHRGAVYIYHGDKKSLKEKYVQHIPAGGDGEKMKFFGQSIHGVMDLNGDGITDVTIGGLGGASLFWSRDVAQLHVNMTFDPAKINLQQSEHQCEHGGRKSVCVKTTVCFNYNVKSDKQIVKEMADIRYTITLDGLRAKARASFNGTDDKIDRKTTKTFTIEHGISRCMEETFMMSTRLDFRDPLMVSLDFGKVNEDQGPVLDESLPKSINKTIPLVDCGTDGKCIADLSLKAEPSVRSMVIKGKENIYVNISVKNLKDRAYNTKVNMSFTPNINFVNVEPEKTSSVNHTKVDFEVGYPFLGNNAEEKLKVKFEVNLEHVGEEIQISVTATSDSEELPSTLSDNNVQISIPVKYEVGLTFKVDVKSPLNNHIEVKQDEKYPLKFSETSMIGEEVNISYTVERLGEVVTPTLDLEVKYPFESPMKNTLLYLTHVTTSSKTMCSAEHQINPFKINREGFKVTKPKKETLSNYLLQDGNTKFESFRCSISGGIKTAQVNVTFRLWKPTFIESEFSGLYLMVNATLNIKEMEGIFQVSSKDRTRSIKIQVSKDTVKGIPFWIIIVSILIGLLILALVIFILWKLGFFKRKSRDYPKEELAE